MLQFCHLLRRSLGRLSGLKKLFSVGWKVILTEALIEIPFLILESSVLMRLLFGFTLGLTFWQYIVLAAALYLLIESGRWAFVRYIRKSGSYRLFQHEWDLTKSLLRGIDQFRRKRFS